MSSTNICSDLYNDPALILVDSAWGIFKNYADEGVSRSLNQIDLINNFTVAFHHWDGSFDANGTLTGFNRPVKPTLSPITAIDLTSQVPEAPNINVPTVGLDAAPTEPASLSNPPSLDFNYRRPDAFDVEAPSVSPTIDVGDLPTAPTLIFPDAPTLDVIVIPDAPNITIPEFAELVPEFDAAAPNEVLNFTETAYSSPILTQVTSQIGNMLVGGNGLPAAVANALWSRAVDRDDRSNIKARQEVIEKFTSRGFDDPNGILAGQMLEVTQNSQNVRGNLNRDIYIQEENIAIESLRFAVSSGLQLESTLLQAHLSIQQRKFDLAKAIKEVALAVFNAQVTKFNALISAYNSKVQAYQSFLEGLKTQVQIYVAEVEAAKAKGEINTQSIQAFSETIKAQGVRSDVYRSEVEGFKSGIDAQRALIEGHRSEVEAYKARVEAYGIEWNAVRSQIEAEVAKGTLYGTIVDGYSSRVNIWAKKQDVAIANTTANINNSEALLRRHDNQVKVLITRLQALETFNKAQSLQSEQEARMYEAEARVEGAAVDADTRIFNAETERARARSDAANRDAALQIQQVTTIAGLLLRSLESAAQATSQLAASSLSAVNFSAGVSSNQGRSKSCSTSFSYSGEIADAGV